ncbi:MAG: hypothetical protein U1F60_09915 [Planctomycetota bacterium]
MQDDEQARRQARRHWPISVHALGCEPPPDPTTPLQRIGMMWELAVQAYAIAGIAIPDYDRAHTPVRVLRRAEADAP